MKRALLLIVAVVAAVALMSASPFAIPDGGQSIVHVAGGDPPDGG